MLAVDALPEGVLALVMVGAWVLSGVARPEVTLTGFSSASWVLVVSVLVALIACNGFFLPYQSTTYLALCHGTGGESFSHAQPRPAAIAYGLLTLLALAASVVFWRMMGLL